MDFNVDLMGAFLTEDSIEIIKIAGIAIIVLSIIGIVSRRIFRGR